jgi:hypothetical protein
LRSIPQLQNGPDLRGQVLSLAKVLLAAATLALVGALVNANIVYKWMEHVNGAV